MKAINYFKLLIILCLVHCDTKNDINDLTTMKTPRVKVTDGALADYTVFKAQSAAFLASWRSNVNANIPAKADDHLNYMFNLLGWTIVSIHTYEEFSKAVCNLSDAQWDLFTGSSIESAGARTMCHTLSPISYNWFQLVHGAFGDEYPFLTGNVTTVRTSYVANSLTLPAKGDALLYIPIFTHTTTKVLYGPIPPIIETKADIINYQYFVPMCIKYINSITRRGQLFNMDYRIDCRDLILNYYLQDSVIWNLYNHDSNSSVVNMAIKGVTPVNLDVTVTDDFTTLLNGVNYNEAKFLMAPSLAPPTGIAAIQGSNFDYGLEINIVKNLTSSDAPQSVLTIPIWASFTDTRSTINLIGGTSVNVLKIGDIAIAADKVAVFLASRLERVTIARRSDDPTKVQFCNSRWNDLNNTFINNPIIGDRISLVTEPFNTYSCSFSRGRILQGYASELLWLSGYAYNVILPITNHNQTESSSVFTTRPLSDLTYLYPTKQRK